MTFTHLN